MKEFFGIPPSAEFCYFEDAQSNIVALIDNNGSAVVKYKYDAWGKCVIDASTTNTELANLNPFRYRSYYYDTETKLYFLKTRYYDPEIGRFMTIDDISYLDPESINGLNLYAYCNNNPLVNFDPTGHFVISLSAIIIGATVGLVVGLATTAYMDYSADGILFNGNNWDYLFYGLTGALSGAIGGALTYAGFALQLGVSAIMGAISNVSEGLYTGEITDVRSLKTLQFAIVGAVTSATSFSLTYGITYGATRIKYQSIIGSNTSNHHINQALRAAGYANLKIGRDGLKKVLDELGKSTSIDIVNYSTGATLDFLSGVLL